MVDGDQGIESGKREASSSKQGMGRECWHWRDSKTHTEPTCALGTFKQAIRSTSSYEPRVQHYHQILLAPYLYTHSHATYT